MKSARIARARDFNKLLVVRIDETFELDARMADRSKLDKRAGAPWTRVLGA